MPDDMDGQARAVLENLKKGLDAVGATFDDIGRGEEEGKSNVSEVSENAASKSLEMLKQVSSSGYLRKRVPQDHLVVLQGGQSMGAVALDSSMDPEAALQTLVPETKTTETALSTGTVTMDARTKAKMQGYEGDPCGDCGNYTLVRNGTGMKCNTCGATSGCS